MTARTKYRSLLVGMIIFWSFVLALLILTTNDAKATRYCDENGNCLELVPEAPVKEDPNQSTWNLMNALTAGEGNYVPTFGGYPLWIPREPYGPGTRRR